MHNTNTPNTNTRPQYVSGDWYHAVGAEWAYYFMETPLAVPYLRNFYRETDEWVFELMQDAIRALLPEPVFDFAYDAPKKKVFHEPYKKAHPQIYPAG